MNTTSKLIHIAAILIAVNTSACMPDYSEGSRVGVINKLSNKGIFFKSWEGEMSLGGFRNKTNVSSGSDGSIHTSTSIVANVFAFTVKDPALVGQIKAAMLSGQPVELEYSQYLLPPLSQGSSYVIVAVRK